MIVIDHVNFGYPKHPTLFKDLSLGFESGNIYGLLGKNGAGKSSLLHLLAGLVFPQKGSIKVSGRQPKERHVDFLADLFLVSEEAFFYSLSIDAYVKNFSPFYPKFNKEKFHQLLNEFELSERKNLDRLSVGQQKKVMISFALSSGCKLLLFDEPTNGLDIPSKKIFRKAIAKGFAEDSILIISTHNIKDIHNLVDAVVILDEGEILFKESIQDILDNLAFKTQFQFSSQDSIYSERIPGGYFSISEKMPEEESTSLDLELLFNAVIEDPHAINTYFTEKT
ncbi:MAG: ABC transporter ATP-binding protein [Bacteroidota bacterium]